MPHYDPGERKKKGEVKKKERGGEIR